MLKMKDLIENMSYNDLLVLKRDLDKGGIITKKIVEMKIKRKEADLNSRCAVCTAPLNKSATFYTLEFGNDDIRKKSSFCGIDCLEYFIRILKDIQKEELHNERI